MVGHRLNKDLKGTLHLFNFSILLFTSIKINLWSLSALKMDHARVIDTSLAFDYNIGNIQVPPARLPRPSLNFLYKVSM